MKVLIITCDKYAWLVPVFLHFYKKYWPDNPYETVIITEKKHIDSDYMVYYAGEASWSSEVLSYLRQSKEEKFILIHEDHLIRKKINTERVKIAEGLCEGDVGCVRLNHAPHKYFNQHTIKTNIKGFKEYPTKRRFSFTMQMAFWQKQYLLDVMREGESAWENEEKGIARLKEMNSKWRILWPKFNIIDYPPRGLLRKGILQPPALRWAKSELSEDSKEYEILENQIKVQGEKNIRED